VVINLNKSDRLVFVMETSVFCTARSGCLNYSLE
jgi:hypothetical protein